ncbi:cobalamin B12-binding domain-containing protein [Acetobacterium sp. K1/6]|uniref:cobalamin B12-binding domain-containing protein n=1 Tax=Acetobacterium sp. K1/6 TaxID=3055467 RepID=UPI002ACAA6A7|nr:cobalamin-dependent protein [Acetobacterium sp. K1/6]MDZ5723412.1 cobalamin-dependent protein [Acetobacterium sp. K1/6]
MLNFKVLKQAMGELEENQVMYLLKEFVATSPSETEALEAIAACQAGISNVRDRFESGNYFLGDLIFASKLLTEAINILKPILGSDEETAAGTIVLGTVHGDLHDLGKTIFKSMSEAAGFKVIDLGIDIEVADFVAKSKELNPQVIGMSGVLTRAIDVMKETTEALKVEGITSNIIIGGNPLTKEVCEFVGADAFTINAAEGVKIYQGWI